MEKEINQKLKWNTILPFLLLSLGISLLIFMIVYEDEPGALPLALILSGIIFLIINWYKAKKQQ